MQVEADVVFLLVPALVFAGQSEAAPMRTPDMQKRVGVWLWAIPVLAASLIFWPIWLVLLASFALSWAVLSLSRARPFPRRAAEKMVVWIARHKYNMLACSIGLTILLTLAALFFAFVEHDREKLTSIMTDLAGYLAVGGLVLGLPALCYAMVTDSAVGRIEDVLGITEAKKDEIEAEIDTELPNFREDLHLPTDEKLFVQIFVPNRLRTKLIPIYDPDKKGPRDGWGIIPDAPQAVTGSAFVGKRYLAGFGSKLKRSKLRLTEMQLKEYENLTAVAAAPIFEDGEPIGVLTVSSSSKDSKMGEPQFQEMHKEAAKSLVDIMKDYIPKLGALEPSDLA